MRARRIIAVSSDLSLAERLGDALELPGCTLETSRVFANLEVEQFGDALWVIYFDGKAIESIQPFLARLGGESRVLVLIPRASLPMLVEVMQASERIAGILAFESIESFEPSRLAQMATRVLTADIFGLEKMLAPDAALQSYVITDYTRKAPCLTQILEHARHAGVSKELRAGIEQCADEMVMNALYDAPVDSKGTSIFAQISAKERIRLCVDAPVIARFGCDGERFALSVRDGFGSLTRATVLRFLHKGIHAEDKVDRRVSGAGLGLYLMVNECSAVYFNVIPGVATEVLCTFDLRAPKQLHQFGVLVEPSDVTGSIESSPPITAPRPIGGRSISRTRIAVVASLALALAAVAITVRHVRSADDTAVLSLSIAPPDAVVELDGREVSAGSTHSVRAHDLYLVTARREGYLPKRTIVRPLVGSSSIALELERIPATLELDSVPKGALALVDGKPVGVTPLDLTSLPAGGDVAIVLRLAGYRDATVRSKVPPLGKRTAVVEQLHPDDGFVAVHFDSQPRGARIVDLGRPNDRSSPTFTPADIFVPVAKEHRFLLTMPKHLPAELPPFTPTLGQAVTRSAELKPAATLHVEAAGNGTISVIGAVHCRELAVPADCALAPGAYTVEYHNPRQAPVRREVTVADRDTSLTF